MQAFDFTPVELIRKFGEYSRREWRRTFSVEYQRGELRKLARLCRLPPTGSLVLCCLMMGLFVVENRTGALQCIQLYGTVPPGLDHLSSITRTAEGQAIPVWLTLFTYMFVHGSWDHVIGNTVAGWVIGNLAERRMGTLQFLLAFVAGGAATSISKGEDLLWVHPLPIVFGWFTVRIWSTVKRVRQMAYGRSA
jgi:hypothetical protein